MNIVESIKEDINADLINNLALANSETVEKTNLTVETSITSLLLAFMKRASTETGLHLLHTLAKDGNFSLQSPTENIFVNDKINKLSDEGNALISKIIPDKKSPLITFVSSYSGVRNATANRTNGVVTLLILNKLKEVSASKGLDLAGLAELFADQKDFLIENAPKPLIEKLSQHIGLGNLISLGSSIITTSASLHTKNIERDKNKSNENTPKYSNSDSQSTGSGFNLKNWIIPILFLLAIIAGGAGYYFWQLNNSDDQDLLQKKDTLININDTLKTTLDSTKIKAKSDTLVVEMEEQFLPNGQKVTLEKGSLGYQIFTFLTDSSRVNSKKINVQNPNFGSGIEIVPEKIESFNEIGKLMKAFPSSGIRVTVNSAVSNDSTSSEKMATKRAFSIKKLIMNAGIQSIRIDAVGKQAVSNDSQNEVELTIMKK